MIISYEFCALSALFQAVWHFDRQNVTWNNVARCVCSSAKGPECPILSEIKIYEFLGWCSNFIRHCQTVISNTDYMWLVGGCNRCVSELSVTLYSSSPPTRFYELRRYISFYFFLFYLDGRPNYKWITLTHSNMSVPITVGRCFNVTPSISQKDGSKLLPWLLAARWTNERRNTFILLSQQVPS